MIKTLVAKTKTLIAKWKGRKRYKFAEMPDWALAYFGVSGFLVSAFYTYVLGQVLPLYLPVANKTPLGEWGVQGWFLTANLALLGLVVLHFGNVAWRCQGLLRDRWYQ